MTADVEHVRLSARRDLLASMLAGDRRIRQQTVSQSRTEVADCAVPVPLLNTTDSPGYRFSESKKMWTACGHSCWDNSNKQRVWTKEGMDKLNDNECFVRCQCSFVNSASRAWSTVRWNRCSFFLFLINDSLLWHGARAC